MSIVETAEIQKSNGQLVEVPQTEEVAAAEHAAKSYSMAFAKVVADRDRFERDLGDALRIIGANRAELEALRSECEIMRSRVQSYQIERDEAVARSAATFARYEALHASILAQLRAFPDPVELTLWDAS